MYGRSFLETSIVNLCVSPQGAIQRWPKSALVRWWRERRGWTFYGVNGIEAQRLRNVFLRSAR